jgi:hypothetical protein
MADITGNKGEWSEIYAFLRLLATGKLFAADESLNRIENMFFPVIKIIREEVRGTKYDYLTGGKVKVCLGDTVVLEVPAAEFEIEADRVFGEIIKRGTTTFSVDETERFMRRIYVNKLKAPSADKADINAQIHDISTGYEQEVGFSIKSDLGHSPTLLNAGKTTNFVFKVKGLPHAKVAEINAIKTDTKILDRMAAIAANGGILKYIRLANDTFASNLKMVDSNMAVILAEMLIAYYNGKAKTCADLLSCAVKSDPLGEKPAFYEHNLKELLYASALAMTPAKAWDGTIKASGGYIIVKTDGDVLAYHIYNSDKFKSYLLKNTCFERGGTTRHEYAALYEENGEVFIKLNLQIRFI